MTAAWNNVNFSCFQKVDSDLADVTLSGSLSHRCAAATIKARSLTVDSLNGGTRR